DTVINTSIFTLNDNEPLVIGPSFSPVEGTQLWIHLQAQLGHGDYARTTVTWWKIDDDNNQIPGTTEFLNIGLNNDDENADTKYGTTKITPAAGYGRYALQFVRTNNSNDHSILKVEAVHIVR
ncbi:phage tail protein, partial [Serratia ureilytica]